MKLQAQKTVYYFKETGPYMGEIVSGKIKAAKKDLFSGKIYYTVEQSVSNLFSEIWGSVTATVSSEHLYTNVKKIKRDYKEYLIYGELQAKIDKLEKLLGKVMEHYAEKIVLETGGLTLTSGEFSSNTLFVNNAKLFVDGIGDVAEEIEKIKKDIANIKKKIKTPKKKTVKAEDAEKK